MKGLLLALLLTGGVAAFGLDFGFSFRQNLEAHGGELGTDLVYAAGLGPWLSVSLRENLDLYLSGSLAVKKYENDVWKLVPELTRFMITWRPVPALTLDAGRVRFNDFNKSLAAGLFDGAAGVYELGTSRLSLGLYYTGLLYKDTADIFMAAADAADYMRELDYGDFAETYYASRRFLAALGWEIPALFDGPNGLSLQALAQFDLNGRDESLHTQYLSLRFLYAPDPAISITLGAIAGFAEISGSRVPDAADLNLALLAEAAWMPPSSPRDMLSLAFRWGSGRVNDTMGPFRPLTTIAQGNVLDMGLAGLMVLSAAYTVQPVEGLSLGLDGRYFMRSDVQTYADYYLKNTGEKALGAELYLEATWVPLVDVSLAAGGGAFFPGLGNALHSGAKTRWKAALSLILSL